MKNIPVAIPLIALLAAAVFLCTANPEQGVRLPADLDLQVSSYPDRYRKLVSDVLRNSPQSLSALIEFDCGGASHCYDHGAVLARIAIVTGDAQFARSVTQLSSNNRQALHVLLPAGVEYGGIDGTETWTEFEARYPATMSAILKR